METRMTNESVWNPRLSRGVDGRPYSRWMVLIAGLLVWLWLVMPGPPVAARSANFLSLPLAPAIAPASPQAQARGVFFQRVVTVTIPFTATQVWLASTPDGVGPLCTDDGATLSVRATAPDVSAGWQWSHDFGQANPQQITCVPAQNLRKTLPPGTYAIALQLTDVRPVTWSTQPYFLILVRERSAAQVQVVAPPRQSPGLSRAQAWEFLAAYTAPQPTPTRNLPERPARDVVSQHPAPTPQAMDAGIPPAATDGQPRLSGLLLVVVGSVGIVGMVLVWVMRHRMTVPVLPRMVGLVDVFDRETRESRTVPLSAYPDGVTILRHPLRLVREHPATEPAQVIARVVPGMEGPLLYAGQPGISQEHDGIGLGQGSTVDAYRVADGTVEIRYRRG